MDEIKCRLPFRENTQRSEAKKQRSDFTTYILESLIHNFSFFIKDFRVLPCNKQHNKT